MINNELDEIMQEYITKAGHFCEKYEKKVLEKKCGNFSRTIEVVFENLESGLWKLKADTKELLYIAHDRFCNRVANNEIVASINLAIEEADRTHNDLNTIHNYYMCKCKSNIAKGLAKQWSEEADEYAFEIMKNALKSLIKAGAENDN